MKYWNSNRKSCEHVEPREDWKESIELWIDWMEAIGRTEETLRTRWYQIVHFSKFVNKSITDVTEDDLIFYLGGHPRPEGRGQNVVHGRKPDAIRREHQGIVLRMRVSVPDGHVQSELGYP